MACCFACRSHPTIFISASFVPSLLVGLPQSLLGSSRGRRRLCHQLRLQECSHRAFHNRVKEMPQRLRPRSSRFLPLYVLLAAGGLLLVAVLSIPVLDGPHSRQYANEAAAVSRLRALTALEKTFAAAHADKGFACEVPLLKAAEKEESGVGHDLPLFLVTGTYAGYKFVLGN